MNMIEVQDLHKTYKIDNQPLKAVDGVSFSIKKGEFVSLMGHSGSGKTTLLSLIGGLTKPTSGKVVINGSDIWSLNDNKLSEFRNTNIGFMFQFGSLIPTLNVLDNVLLPVSFGGNSKKETKKRAIEYIDLVGLGDRMRSYPSQLSGGQQRRVAIARALVNNPDIILADEPTGDLDAVTEGEILRLFQKINVEKDITFMIVTHSQTIADYAERMITMTDGKVFEE
jgi:ABC-type lipoprotein export system ATPase subunit